MVDSVWVFQLIRPASLIQVRAAAEPELIRSIGIAISLVEPWIYHQSASTPRQAALRI